MSKLLWTQKQDIGPAPRFGHAMAFDQIKQRVLLFGGEGGGQQFKDTWEWDGAHWTQVEDIGPSARSGHAMAYDSIRGRTVLFGGHSGAGDLNDTWEWDGSSWTQIQDRGPSPRRFHAMVFDNARGRVVLFGGLGADETARGDTWEWDGDNWTQVDDTGPAARSGHAMTYDTARQRIVLFGGGGAGPDGLSDTWERDDAAWTEVQEIGPPGAIQAALVFRSTVSALFGGSSTRDPQGNPVSFGVTWEWDGAHWTARQDIGVGARFGHAMAFDTIRQCVVLFGGLGQPDAAEPNAGPTKGDTWEHADVQEGGAGPRIASFAVTPNPVLAGQTLAMSAQLLVPVNVPTTVDLLFSGPLAGIPGIPVSMVINIPAMTAGGVSTWQLPPNIAMARPIPLTVTARIGQGPAVLRLVSVS